MTKPFYLKEPFKQSRTTAGFTLIELLTVIAIIGILASILIPVVGAVRESARKSKCMSQMRQVGLAILAYESEYGVLPGPSYRRVRKPVSRSADYREINWTLSDYVGLRSEVFECPTNSSVFDSTMNPGNVAFLLNNTSNAERSNPPRYFGYPSRAQSNPWVPGGIMPADNQGMPKSLEQIISAGTGTEGMERTELSQIWMISDVDGGNYSASSIGTIRTDSVPLHDAAGYVHGDGRNYVFFDGHAEYRKHDDLPWYGYPVSQH
ncbi:MAG TPA: prepilin-type N-terminal cleavage/methylation domain-containing protein [Opitutales bacterium]|nr:prepilin-type N-terminal cleavage/methylation domain-containing protein [Opitutales bacterium]